MKTRKHRHIPCKSIERCYLKPVAGKNEDLRARGNISILEWCSCGAARKGIRIFIGASDEA